MEDLIKQSFEDLKNLYGQNGAMQLAAIWLSEKVQVTRGEETYLTKRIVAGDIIRIEDKNICSNGDPTHNIIDCFGDIYNTYLSIMVCSLDDIDIQIIQLK